MRKKKKSAGITSPVTAPIIPAPTKGRRGRNVRDGLTRVTSPIKGTDTHSRQWNRWDP